MGKVKAEYLNNFLIVQNPNLETLNEMTILGYEVTEEEATERVNDILENPSKGDISKLILQRQEFYIYKLAGIIRPVSVTVKSTHERIGSWPRQKRSI